MWRSWRARRYPNLLWQHQLQLTQCKRCNARLSTRQSQDEAPQEPPDSKATPLLDKEASTGIRGVGKDQDGSRRSLRKINLPLSPLMDPKLIAARERHRAPKPAPSQERSDFSQKLRNNPYALALASPVRQCNITGLRLPDHFHLEFGLQPHPTTGAPWHLPRLASEAPRKPEIGDTSEQTVSDMADFDVQQEHPTSAPSEPSTLDPKPLRTLSSNYLSARAVAMRFISKLRRREHARLLPFRWKEDPTLKLNDIVWREDMDEYILSLMRHDIVRKLTYLSSQPAGYIARCDGWDHIDKHRQVAATLWLGEAVPAFKFHRDEEEPVASVDAAGSKEWDTGPPAYAMVHYRDRYIPTYNLPSLMGRKQLGRWMSGCPQLRGSMAVVKQKHNTVGLQLALWKLMGYLAPYDGN